MYDSRVILVRVNLQGVLKGKQGLVELSKKLIGQLNHIMVSDDDGFWLCLPKNGMVKSDPVVWDPYLGQVRWIKPSKIYSMFDSYCMGYDNKNNHKILRRLFYQGTVEYEIYDFKSDSWRVLDVTCNWIIHHYRQGFSLKGNTYFVAQGREEGLRESLICFDLQVRDSDIVLIWNLTTVRETL